MFGPTNKEVLMLLKALLIGTAVLTLGAGFGQAAAKPSGFSARIDNPWFPLKPGSVYVYRGVKDGQPSREVLTVMHATATINGAPCAVIHDRLYVRGQLEERTTDWYTQDKQGNVWYYGEQTATLATNGSVTSTEGTWRAGKDGAQPGIYMPASPTVGMTARQEFYKGHAEDHVEILNLRAPVKVSWGKSSQALLTKEWTPLEPGVIDHKYYIRGVGTVLEQTVKGGNERNELVSFKPAK
jgi:hypothetical protein